MAQLSGMFIYPVVHVECTVLPATINRMVGTFKDHVTRPHSLIGGFTECSDEDCVLSIRLEDKFSTVPLYKDGDPELARNQEDYIRIL